MPSPLSPSRFVSLACFGTWGLLTTIQFGLIPFGHYAWGFNFWRYLPDWAGLLFAATSLCLCLGAVRRGLFRGVSESLKWVERATKHNAETASCIVIFLLLWLLRERYMFGDSGLLLLASQAGWQFVFPDMGTTFLLQSAVRLGNAFSIDPKLPVQILSCACGSLTFMFLMRSAPYLAPGRLGVAIVALFVLSGGIIRVFAGHIEVYAVLLTAVSAYLWLALAFLGARSSWVVTSLSLGLAIWLHLSALLLLPSLLLLPLLPPSMLGLRQTVRRLGLGIALAAFPSILFLLVMLLLGHHEDLVRAWSSALQILGQRTDPNIVQRWVRGWGGPPSIGTDYVLLSLPHLKYLWNASYVLVPSTIPVLLAFGVFAPRRFLMGPRARFLSVASAPLVVYACVLRPVWGPFDWDLFAITALCLATLCAHLLATTLPELILRHVGTWLIGFHLLFVGIPFLVIGITSTHAAGPFLRDSFQLELALPGPPPPEIAPWL